MYEDASAAKFAEFIKGEHDSTLNSYKERPDNIRENAGQEAAIVQGGYREKQVQELIQNAVDAVRGSHGRIHVLLTSSHLYVANEGKPFTRSGLRTLLHSNMSDKRDQQIGRFGLGFKSVLQISHCPQIFSALGAVGFDRDRSRAELVEIQPGLDEYPVLRLPYLLDREHEVARDPHLAELLSWATTVVRLPLLERPDWLIKAVREFRPEFLLFNRFIDSITLEIVDTQEWRITWSAESSAVGSHGNVVRLTNNDDSRDWLVMSQVHQPSSPAQKEAGALHARDELTVSWAFPIQAGRNRVRGEIWNHFPTGTKSTMPGIVNAPFKMNDDRMTVLESLYNAEIFNSIVPQLVVAGMPFLTQPDDPGAHLDSLPARGREDLDWYRKNLIDPVTRAVALAASIPDVTGVLRTASEIHVRPEALNGQSDVIAKWHHHARELAITAWAHESALSSSFRGPAVDRLLAINNVARVTVAEWIEGLTQSRTTSGYSAAVRFAAEFSDLDGGRLNEIRDARVVLMADGTVAKLSDSLYFAESPTQVEPGIVDPELSNGPEVNEALRAFGAQLLDGAARLAQTLKAALSAPEDHDKALHFWRTAEQLTPSDVRTVIERADPSRQIRVRTAAGTWIPLAHAWQSGPILDARQYDDSKLVIDPEHPFFTSRSSTVLSVSRTLPEQALVATSRADAQWRDAIEKGEREEIRDVVGRGSNATVSFGGNVAETPRLDELSESSPQSRGRITQELLRRPQRKVAVKVDLMYPGDGGRMYKEQVSKQFAPPDIAWIRRYGMLHTSYGWIPAGACTLPINGIPENLLPVPDDLETVESAGVLTNSSTINPAQWQLIFTMAEEGLDTEQLHQLYGHAAMSGAPRPKELVACRGATGSVERLARQHCVVALTSDSREHILQRSDLGVIDSGDLDRNNAIAENWDLLEVEIEFSTHYTYTESSPEDKRRKIKDRFPYLRKVDGKFTKINQFELVPCTELQEVTTNDFDDVESSVDTSLAVHQGDEPSERQIFYRSTLRDKGILTRLIEHVGSSRTADDLLRSMDELRKESELEDFWDELQNQKSDQDRVLLLLGEEGLRELVPESALDLLREEGQDVTPALLFSLAQNMHGSDLWKVILSRIPEELSISEWAQEARTKDLTDLGFEPDMFRRQVQRPPAREEVMGPVRLNKLHKYQKATSDQIVKVLRARPGANKAIVQLPTGAGKTRVAIESLIRHVKATSLEHQVIVWVAQSEELCEQAVEAWLSGWQALGIEGERLTVSRLWGSRTVESESTRLQVVVATIQKLNSIVTSEKDSTGRVKYAWLSDPDVVVIDEAHGAIAPSYTSVLRWFKRSTGQKGKPLLGLSATPYRGVSAEATERLVKRFEGKLIEPIDYFTAETAHEYLQDLGVLARVRQEELEGSILLQQRPGRRTGDDGLEGPRKLLEQRIDLESVATDNDRNKQIVQHIVSHDDEIQHAIVFAASVEHAQALAAVLHSKGISAAAIHAGTDLSRRRTLIQRFKDGDLRVLTNFDVLSQGFDAPKVDAVYLCRPTFSPNKYIQMIGRGLRGPLNGGSEEVLIVNVRDNLENFGESLAYTEFAYLWEESGAGA